MSSGRLDVIVLHVDDADGHVHACGDRGDQLDFRELAAGHLQVHLVDVHVEKRRKQARVAPRRHGAALVVAEAQVRRQPRAPAHGRDRLVEDGDEPPRIFDVAVAAHRRLVDADILASLGDQRLQFAPHDRKQRVRQREPIRILPVRHQAPAERIWPRHARLQRDVRRRNALQPAELFDDAEPARRGEIADHLVFAALIVAGRPEPALRRGLRRNARQKAVERQIEIEPRLLAVSDDGQSSSELIAHRHSHRIVQHLGKVVGSEGVEMLRGMFEPRRQRITSDHSRS